jgi:hypothetical protein
MGSPSDARSTETMISKFGYWRLSKDANVLRRSSEEVGESTALVGTTTDTGGWGTTPLRRLLRGCHRAQAVVTKSQPRDADQKTRASILRSSKLYVLAGNSGPFVPFW